MEGQKHVSKETAYCKLM